MLLCVGAEYQPASSPRVYLARVCWRPSYVGHLSGRKTMGLWWNREAAIRIEAFVNVRRCKLTGNLTRCIQYKRSRFDLHCAISTAQLLKRWIRTSVAFVHCCRRNAKICRVRILCYGHWRTLGLLLLNSCDGASLCSYEWSVERRWMVRDRLSCIRNIDWNCIVKGSPFVILNLTNIRPHRQVPTGLMGSQL